MKILLINLYFIISSSLLFGVEIDKKAHDQALKDLELSKKQASLLLHDEMKKFDLSRLPPHYKKMLEKTLYGEVPDAKALAKLKANYDKVIQKTLKHTSSGKGGNFSQLNKIFQNIISGKAKLLSRKIPFKSNLPKKAVSSLSNKKRTGIRARGKDLKDKSNLARKVELTDVDKKKKFDLFVNDSKKFLEGRGVLNIFDRHSEVYLNDIFSKLNIKGERR